MKTALAASLVSLLLLSGCQAASEAGNTPEPLSGEVVGVRDGQTLVRVGQSLAIGLPSNATTGYQWQVSGVEGSVLTPGTPFGEEVTDAHQPGLVGVGGVTHWRLTAARPGSVTLTFTYRRAWERDIPPAETATYKIVVR
jgi:inhibitor of cysteine peptidase